MATTGIEKFKNSIARFLPRGFAWAAKSSNSNISKLIKSLAIEFNRIQKRIDQMFIERDPRKANELLVDWETALGLPDECTNLAGTVQERRAQVVQKLTNVGGSSFEYFESVAESLGFNVTVSDFQRFQAGKSVAGDALTNADWDFWFQVTAPTSLTTVFKAGIGKAGDKLVTLGNETLECTFEKLKPAHTEVLFVFV